MVDRTFVLLSCEHGGNRIPCAYRHLFGAQQRLLASHRGFDAGSLTLARSLARHLQAPLHYATVSRLLVDLNRSLHHRASFSAVTRSLPETDKQAIVRRYYEPYRRRVEQAIAQAMAGARRVLHLSVHSFTPQLGGDLRTADIGLLYDPARAWERALARRLQATLVVRCPQWAVRRNYPYRGTGDGFTTALRRLFADARYAGIEIEVNQSRVAGDVAEWRALRRCLAEAIAAAVTD